MPYPPNSPDLPPNKKAAMLPQRGIAARLHRIAFRTTKTRPPQIDIGTDTEGNHNIQLKNDEPYLFEQHDEWEVVLQLWEFDQRFVNRDDEELHEKPLKSED